MEQQLQLHKEFREKQEKLIYYVIALSVTAIGFSVVKTTGQPIKLTQIPLAIAVISWGASIYFGFNFIRLSTAALYRTGVFYDTMQGEDSKSENDRQKIATALETYNKGNKVVNKMGTRFTTTQEWLFYIGIIFFIVWHVIEMAFTSVPQT